MGSGYEFKCKKCKKRYAIRLGVGMMMPAMFNETIEEIRRGEWGNEFKEIIDREPFITPDVEEELYICRSCGKWKVEKNMNLYAPNYPEALLNKQDSGRTPFAMRRELKEAYHLMKRRIHYCECGKRMHKVSDSEANTLTCPYCGTTNTAENFVCWD